MDNSNLLQPDKIIRSSRRTLALEITRNNELIVRAPNRVSLEHIHKFIIDKAQWIISKRTNFESKPKPNKLDLSDGVEVEVLGTSYTLQSSNSNRVKCVGNTLYLPNDRETAFVAFLKKSLKQYLTKRVEYIATTYNFSYKSVSVSSARTNWGSCSYNNALHFTYRLALCPLGVIDYIIVHELVHTKVKNHSRAFYLMVSKIMPNYKEANRYLKDHRVLMEIV